MTEIPPGIGKNVVERSAPGNDTTKSKTVSYLEAATQGIADAAGRCEVELGMVPANADWFIERISVETDSILASAFGIFKDADEARYRKDYTPTGNNDIADESQAIWIPSNSRVLAIWTGCTPASICTVNAQIRVEV